MPLNLWKATSFRLIHNVQSSFRRSSLALTQITQMTYIWRLPLYCFPAHKLCSLYFQEIKPGPDTDDLHMEGYLCFPLIHYLHSIFQEIKPGPDTDDLHMEGYLCFPAHTLCSLYFQEIKPGPDTDDTDDLHMEGYLFTVSCSYTMFTLLSGDQAWSRHR